jgi:AraC-like DNA-binding protein
MASRLDRITNWPQFARDSGYRTKELAKILRVTRRQLERFFLTKHRVQVGIWMDKCIVSDSIPLLRQGRQVQEVASALGFSSPGSFSKTFHRILGAPPKHFAAGEIDVRATDSDRLGKMSHFDMRLVLHLSPPSSTSEAVQRDQLSTTLNPVDLRRYELGMIAQTEIQSAFGPPGKAGLDTCSTKGE